VAAVASSSFSRRVAVKKYTRPTKVGIYFARIRGRFAASFQERCALCSIRVLGSFTYTSRIVCQEQAPDTYTPP
jgi:hypothetical protein